MLQLHCVRKLPHNKPVVEKSLSKYYVGAQREIFAGFFFFFLVSYVIPSFMGLNLVKGKAFLLTMLLNFLQPRNDVMYAA